MNFRTVSPAVVARNSLVFEINAHFHKVLRSDVVDVVLATEYIPGRFRVFVGDLFRGQVRPLVVVLAGLFRIKVFDAVAQGIEFNGLRSDDGQRAALVGQTEPTDIGAVSIFLETPMKGQIP